MWIFRRKKHAEIGLTYIYGIGELPRERSSAAQVDSTKKVRDLGEDEVNRIRQVIERRAQSKATFAKKSRCTSSG